MRYTWILALFATACSYTYPCYHDEHKVSGGCACEEGYHAESDRCVPNDLPYASVSPQQFRFVDNDTWTLTANAADSTVYFTTDGSIPTKDSSHSKGSVTFSTPSPPQTFRLNYFVETYKFLKGNVNQMVFEYAPPVPDAGVSEEGDASDGSIVVTSDGGVLDGGSSDAGE